MQVVCGPYRKVSSEATRIVIYYVKKFKNTAVFSTVNRNKNRNPENFKIDYL